MPTLNDIHDKLEGIEDAIVGGVKHVIKLPLWVKIVAGAVVVLLIVLLVSVFKKREPVNEDYKSTMRTLDTLVKQYEKQIETLQKVNEKSDTIIAQQDALLKNNKVTQTRIIHSYDKVPDNVKSLDKSGLRREVSEY